MQYLNRRVLVGGLALSLAIGCSSSEAVPEDGPGAGGAKGGGEPEASEVELISWWNGPGEAEALQALINAHEKRNPGVKVFNAALADGTSAQDAIDERLQAGDPPDLFQENVSDIPEVLADNPGSLDTLDDLFEKNGWADVFLPEVMDEITIDGHIYAMPVGIHRENTLFINQGIFTKYDLAPPETIDDLWAICDTLKAEGITPIATGYQGWILRIMFHSVAMSTMGGQEYEAFFTGNGDADDPALRETIQNFEKILKEYVADDMKVGEFGWQEASQALFDGDAAMFFHGDWVGGYVQQLGWEAGTDYTAVSAPGAEDVFLFGVDAFALPADSKNKEGALSFFETVGSLEGQAAFNNIKGSTPVRLDADKSQLSEVGKATLEALATADVVIRTPTWTDVDDAILAYAEDFDEDALVTFFQEAIYQ